MPFWFFIWDEENTRKVAEHGLTPQECEFVVENPFRLTRSRRSDRPLAVGYTHTGRYIVVPFDVLDSATVRVVTAYEMAD